MNRWNRIFLATCISTMVCLTISFGQVTITESDMSSAFANTAFLSQTDSLQRNLNLGNSSDGQTWDFSFITFNAVSGRRDTQDYVSPAGQPEQDSFPTATQAFVQTISFADSIWTTNVKFVIYFVLQSNGLYVVGEGIHAVTTPTPPPGYPFPADSMWAIFSSSAQKSIALPLSGNSAVWTSHDTLNDTFTPGKFTENFHRYAPAGSGMMKIPGGATVSVVRYLETDSAIVHSPGGGTSTSVNYSVVFFGNDGTQANFAVDGSYSSGSFSPTHYTLVTKIGSATGVKQIPNRIPANFTLQQNYPNPFNPTTGIEFSLPDKQFVTVGVYNVLGQEMAELVRGTYPAGTYHIEFNAANLPSGVYLYRIAAGDFTQTRKMLLVK